MSPINCAREKSCDYALIIYKKIYEIAYHNYAEAKRAHQVHSVKTTACDQNSNIQWYFHIYQAQKSSKSGKTVQGIVQSVSESLSMEWKVIVVCEV